MPKLSIAVEWLNPPMEGTIEATYADVIALSVAFGDGTSTGDRFIIRHGKRSRLIIAFSPHAEDVAKGLSPQVTIHTDQNTVSAFIGDITAEHPIFIPSHGLVFTTPDDTRSYDEIADSIRTANYLDDFARWDSEPEESYDSASLNVRSLSCQTWLGLSRDMRLFEIALHREAGYWGWIRPMLPVKPVTVPEVPDMPLRYSFVAGRGASCKVTASRRLEEGYLPILHGAAWDGDAKYDLISFASYEHTPLRIDTLRGTHYLVAHGSCAGNMMTPDQKQRYDELEPLEANPEEEVVLFIRVTATNLARVPRYAWFKAPYLDTWPPNKIEHYESETGFGVFSERVFCCARFNNQSLPRQEMSVLLQPGENAVLEFAIPHRPISRDRAMELAKFDFGSRHAECRAFWKAKLSAAAGISLPEQRIEEMMKAGLLHLDLITYGNEPDGTLAPTIGIYSPIGTESAPITMFMDSMGWHEIARRAIDFFFDQQHDDGFIQNFGGYMVETGAALFQAGQHIRMTHDMEWARKIMPKAIKACNYLIEWRCRNLKEALIGKGYGMIDGKVADPEDETHYFMNSGYAYAGLSQTAEWLAELDPAAAESISREARSLRTDIRASLQSAMDRSPVIPLGDGTWAPTVAPWAEATGPQMLHAEGQLCFSHHTFSTRDSLIGPLYLIFTEVVDPKEPMGEFLLRAHHELATIRNVAFSQPYYSRHDFAHLRRDEVSAFLKTYYNSFAALADRETYTFWEHFFHASPHKTHEEGWFLMQSRWMLVMEEGRDCFFFRAIPRKWMEDGEKIALEGWATTFGPVDLRVESHIGGGNRDRIIEAKFDFKDARRLPQRVILRLPHPQRILPKTVVGGEYDTVHESVVVMIEKAENTVLIRF